MTPEERFIPPDLGSVCIVPATAGRFGFDHGMIEMKRMQRFQVQIISKIEIPSNDYSKNVIRKIVSTLIVYFDISDMILHKDLFTHFCSLP